MKQIKHFTLIFCPLIFLTLLFINNTQAQENNILLYYNSYENPIDTLGWNSGLIFDNDMPPDGERDPYLFPADV